MSFFLPGIILFPLIGVLLIWIVPAHYGRVVAQGIVIAQGTLSLIPMMIFAPGPGVLIEQRQLWISSLGAELHLGLDGISIPLLPMVALCVGVSLGSERRIPPYPRVWYSTLLIWISVLCGLLSTLDLVLFFVFWELSILPIGFLGLLSGGERRRFAATRLVLTMLISGIPFLYALVILSGQGPIGTPFDLGTLAQAHLPLSTQKILFWLLLTSFAVKLPLVPFHSWMPTFLLDGPAGASILLVGMKTGIYALLRVLLPIAPEAAHLYASPLATAGIFGVLFGAILTITQPNLRRIIAYGSLSHVGVATVALASGTPTSLTGAWFMLIDFSVTATGLMMMTEFLQRRVGSTDLTHLGGLVRLPRLSAFLLLFLAASVGLPGLSGFVGEWLAVTGSYTALPGHALLLVVGLAIGISGPAYWLAQALGGPLNRPEIEVAEDVGNKEAILGAGLFGISLVLGIYPGWILHWAEPTLAILAARLGNPG